MRNTKLAKTMKKRTINNTRSQGSTATLGFTSAKIIKNEDISKMYTRTRERVATNRPELRFHKCNLGTLSLDPRSGSVSGLELPGEGADLGR